MIQSLKLVILLLIMIIFIVVFSNITLAEIKFDFNEKENSLMIIPGYCNKYSVKGFQFPGGKKIKVKIGSKDYISGTKGGDYRRIPLYERFYISIWIDEVKVIKEYFSTDYENNPSLKVEINERGYILYKYQSNSSSTLFSNHSLSESIFISKDKFPIKKDLVEYPVDKIKPEPDQVVVVYGLEDELTTKIINSTVEEGGSGYLYWYPIGPPDDAKYRFKGEKYNYGYAGYLKKIVFDIDNDGVKEDVIKYSSRTRYRDGDMFFIYPQGRSPSFNLKKEIKSEGIDKLSQNAPRIFPYSWTQEERDIDGREMYSLITDLDIWWSSLESISLCTRYTHYWPFIYNEETYFLATPILGNWFVLLKPKKDKLKLINVFILVKPNL